MNSDASTSGQCGASPLEPAGSATAPAATGGAPAWEPWTHYSRRQRRLFLFVLFLVATSNYVDRNIIGVLLEPIKREFGVSDTMLGLLSGASFAVLYATLGLPVARWADRGNRKHVISVSLSIWSAMTLLCGFAANFWQLAAARIGVGAGEAGAVPPAQSLLADYFPPSERAGAIGIFVMSASAGYAIGLIGGGYLTENYGWRVTFILFGLVGGLLAPLVHLVLREPRKEIVRPPSHERQEALPEAVRALLRKRSYRYIVLSLILYYMMASGGLAFIVSLMIRAHGMSVAGAGALFGGIFAAGAVIGSLIGGVVADRLVSRDVGWLARSASAGMLVAAPAYLLAIWTSSLPVMIPLLLVGAIAVHAAIPPAFSAIHAVCGARRRALAVALFLFIANLIGVAGGPLITGMLSDWLGPGAGDGEGLRMALLVMTVLLLPAAWLMSRAVGAMAAEAEA